MNGYGKVLVVELVESVKSVMHLYVIATAQAAEDAQNPSGLPHLIRA